MSIFCSVPSTRPGVRSRSIYFNTYGLVFSCSSLSLLVGFLFFETFAYLGLRRLKYANRVRPETPDEPTTDSSRTT